MTYRWQPPACAWSPVMRCLSLRVPDFCSVVTCGRSVSGYSRLTTTPGVGLVRRLVLAGVIEQQFVLGHLQGCLCFHDRSTPAQAFSAEHVKHQPEAGNAYRRDVQFRPFMMTGTQFTNPLEPPDPRHLGGRLGRRRHARAAGVGIDRRKRLPAQAACRRSPSRRPVPPSCQSNPTVRWRRVAAVRWCRRQCRARPQCPIPYRPAH